MLAPARSMIGTCKAYIIEVAEGILGRGGNVDSSVHLCNSTIANSVVASTAPVRLLEARTSDCRTNHRS